VRLSINGWHPIASHLVCIITGIALSNVLGRQVRAASPPRGELTFSLNLSQIESRSEIAAAGQQVNIYKITGKRQDCKMFKNPLNVSIESNTLHFSTLIGEQAGLQHLLKEIKQRNKVGIDRNLSKVPLCRSKPKVQYGS